MKIHVVELCLHGRIFGLKVVERIGHVVVVLEGEVGSEKHQLTGKKLDPL